MRNFSVLILIWLGLTSSAAAQEWMQVAITLDPSGGRAVGHAVSASGDRQAILIERPTLAESADPFSGYIDAEGVLLPEEAGWLPPLAAGEAGWAVRVEAPAGMVAVPYPSGSVEVLADGRAATEMRIPRAIARAPLIAGRFRIGERDVDGVTIRTFFTEKNAGQSPGYIDAAGEAIQALSTKIGPYPYGGFSVVESPLPVGLGFPGFTLVSGRILPYPFMRGRSLWHEIAHVWWGNGVLVDYDAGNWAEGFATFFADYALAERAGPDVAKEMRYDWLLAFDAITPDQDVPLRSFVAKSHGQAQVVGYGKAAMTLHMLRRELGQAAFDAGVARFWRDHKFQKAGWAEIEDAFEAESGRDLGSFFDRWIEQPGAELSDVRDNDFHVFRALAPEERIATLRAAFAPGAYDIRPLDGAPGDMDALAGAIGRLGKIGGGTPVYIGDAAALGETLDHMPNELGRAAIWAATDKDGVLALGVAATAIEDIATLMGRVRHYGRWSWLTVGADGRPQRGRWPIR